LGAAKAERGVVRKQGQTKRVVYKPKTDREKAILRLGLTPFEYKEMIKRETEGKKTWLDKHIEELIEDAEREND
jgi:hypothetical protein